MYSLYSLLLTLGLVALLPRFLYDAIRHGKYIDGLRQRLGSLPSFDSDGRPVIWLHCVSVGETQAARPLAERLLEEFPSHRLVVSTITLTGQRIAREVFATKAQAVIYFPFDWRWSVRRALRAINPSVVLIMETELWPNFLRECVRLEIPVALVNGRLSEGSFRRYKLVRRFTARIVDCLNLAVMQSKADAERIRGLGLSSSRVMVSGNVKFDADVPSGEQDLSRELDARFHFGRGRPLIVAASTHAPEERILVEAFRRLRAARGECAARLLVAPRHPERFAETASLLDTSGLDWTRRSSPPGRRDDADVILLDTIGELRAVYRFASLVFVGGSIAPTGGHNVLEPAAVGACIITGAHTRNFEAIMRAFLEADALIQLPDLQETEAASELARVFGDMLADDERRRAIGARARSLVEQNRGASRRTVKLLAPLLLLSPDDDSLAHPQDARSDVLSA
ncbi:MAG TPA: 3-deoxy-D-manno-octulosonic acid transferase [Pyrinomonadaceae bacterium]|jgi:3-deoxy-D-manno-octulosonic-acid transferase|nr:3-deoxy-D-manno-octulosonic acid transferase [Pyrinomonadaceae bacterium]